MRTAWREHLTVHLDDLDNRLVELREVADPDARHQRLVQRAASALGEARNAVQTTSWWRQLGSAWTGVDIEKAWTNAHAAEVAMLRLTPVGELRPMLTSVLARSELLLLKRDSRVKRLRDRAGAGGNLTDADRELAAATLTAAFGASEAEHVRVRSFRNLLLVSTVVVAALVVVIAWAAIKWPSAFALCGSAADHKPSRCPVGGREPGGRDVVAVELLGLFAAAITAAIAIRGLRGTSTPYAVPLASQLLKLPVGALTAVGGLLLARGGFFPALNHLSAAQARAYALVFGASQQLFMHLVDRQAQAVLNSVKTADRDRAKRSGRRRR